MTNITFSIDKTLHSQMRAHPEIKWTEILRQSIRDFLAKIDEPKEISMQELRARLSPESLENLTHLDIEKEGKFTAQSQKMEEARLKHLEELEKQADE